MRVWVDGEPIIDAWFDQPATTYQASRYLTAGEHEVKVEYYEAGGNAVAQVSWQKDNSGPTATIGSPSSTLKWKVGDTINFSGSATDPKDGTLPDSALSWSVILHHCSPDDPSSCHTHDVQSFDGVASGSFSAPDHEYPSYLELRLTATDSRGLKDIKSVRLDPQTVDLTLQSNPSGLQLVDGSSSATAPYNRTVIVGSKNSISAPSPQTLGGATYSFSSWSDGGAQSHDIVAGAEPSTYTATYTTAGQQPPPTSGPPAPGSPAPGPPSSGKHKKHKKHKKHGRHH